MEHAHNAQLKMMNTPLFVQLFEGKLTRICLQTAHPVYANLTADNVFVVLCVLQVTLSVWTMNSK